MANPRICSINGCGKSQKNSRGWCVAHYTRFLRHGDPLGGARFRNGEPERFYFDVVLPHTGDECLTWPFGRTNAGYGTLWLNGKKSIVSKLVCEYRHGPSPGKDAAHSCGRGKQACVAGNHLSWKTRKENEADKLIHGTRHRGDSCSFSKITDADIAEIRRLGPEMAYREIGNRYGISHKYVEAIVNRRTKR